MGRGDDLTPPDPEGEGFTDDGTPDETLRSTAQTKPVSSPSVTHCVRGWGPMFVTFTLRKSD